MHASQLWHIHKTRQTIPIQLKQLMNWNWAVSQPNSNQSITHNEHFTLALTLSLSLYFRCVWTTASSAVILSAFESAWLWSPIKTCEQSFSISSQIPFHSRHVLMFMSHLCLNVSNDRTQIENREKFDDWFDYKRTTCSKVRMTSERPIGEREHENLSIFVKVNERESPRALCRFLYSRHHKAWNDCLAVLHWIDLSKCKVLDVLQNNVCQFWLISVLRIGART